MNLKKKRLSFVLTGGSSPINLYKNLSKTNLNWKNIDFFWGDERYVSNKSIHSKNEYAKSAGINIVTEISEAKEFYKAEEYHQNYYKQNKTAGYCRAVISPKIIKARKKLSKYFK